MYFASLLDRHSSATTRYLTIRQRHTTMQLAVAIFPTKQPTIRQKRAEAGYHRAHITAGITRQINHHTLGVFMRLQAICECVGIFFGLGGGTNKRRQTYMDIVAAALQAWERKRHGAFAIAPYHRLGAKEAVLTTSYMHGLGNGWVGIFVAFGRFDTIERFAAGFLPSFAVGIQATIQQLYSHLAITLWAGRQQIQRHTHTPTYGWAIVVYQTQQHNQAKPATYAKAECQPFE